MTEIHTVYEVRDTSGIVAVTSDPDEAECHSRAGRHVTAETTEVPMA